MKANPTDFRFIAIVLALLLAGAAACQWGLREGGPGDGEAEGEEEDAIEGADIDVAVEDGREDPAGEEADLEDVPDGEGVCTSDGQCDDGEPCSGEETCGDDGLCVGGTPLEDGTGCATTEVPDGVCRGGRCVSSLCGNGEVDDGEECDDGNMTPDDGCEIGCAYSCHAAANCNDDEFCTIDSCVPNAAGMICEHENSTAACDDESECTESDTCSDGTCTGTAVDCDDDDDCTDDGCDAAAGCTHAFNTAGCDDGNDCTGGDVCDGAGTCAGTTFTCPCTVLTDCDVYDDGDLCNGRLLCDTDGFCKVDPDSVVTCDPSGDSDCLKNRCNPDTGVCGMQDEPDGTDCDDADACTNGEACAAGGCTGGTSVVCDDHLDCTEDSCSPADGCHYTALTGTACEDGNLCTAPDVCSAGSCVPGADVGCGDLNDCTSDICNPADGCHHTDLTGTDCSDGDACTSPDVCQSGVCVPGARICGCTTTADCLPYEDGDPCNGTLVCDASGDCVVDPATIITCDPSSDTDCLKNRCDPSTGSCRMWEEPNGTTCSDGSVCTPVDICASGLCTGTGTLPCGDGNVCTIDGCDPVTGCTHEPDSGASCDDGLYCTRTDQCNGAGACIGTGATCDDGHACTTDTCNEGSDSCSNTVDTGFCLIAGTCIADGTVNPDNDCQECDDAVSRTAWSPRASGTACDDDLFCTLTDLCNASGACIGAGATCDDGLACTTDACNETANTCANTLQAGFCLIDGVCRASGTDNPANDCQACVPGTSTTFWTNKPPGSTCAGDGVGCTSDACNSSGVCLSTPDDTSCAPGDLCLPACSADASGCVTPPLSLDLSCTSPVTLPAASDCTINLGGLAGQTSCLACRSEAGMVVLDYSDFGDESGACHADGWTLLNAGCTAGVDACTPAGTGTCCTNFATVCEATTSGAFILRTNQATNCAPTGLEQWRMTKTFDTRGLANLQLCFSIGDRDATANEGIIVQVAAGASLSQVHCQNGGPQPFVNDVLYPTCVNLPGWAADNAAVTVTFIMHSEDNWDWMLLDSVSLRGWVSGCTPATTTIPIATFDACDLTGWTVTGTPNCPGTWSCPAAGTGLQAQSETWSIERSVDASGLDGNVTLCFAYGDNNTASPGYLRAEFNARDGAGWRTAWLHTGKMGANQTCREVCVNLSDIDADVNRNGSLGIRFTIQETAGGTINLDTISLLGAVYCDGAGRVTLSGISEAGGGLYTFTATDTAATTLDADVQCTWDTPALPIGDWASIRYRR